MLLWDLVYDRVKMPNSRERRPLELTSLQAVEQELARLSGAPYERVGNWTLGQACRHLALDIRSSIDGYPNYTYLFAPLRPFVRWLLLPKLLRFESPSGIRAPAAYVPADDVDDQQGLKEYREQIARFLSHEGRYQTHPGFGFNTRENLERIYSAHAAHHLSFLLPATGEGSG